MPKIVNCIMAQRIFILSDGGSIPIAEFPNGRVGMNVEFVEGQWEMQTKDEAGCNV